MIELTFILFLASALSQEVPLVLDDAPNAVDDTYSTCRDEMLRTVADEGLLSAELNATAVFQKAWSKSSCKTSIPGGSQRHTTALEVFTKNKELRKAFNAAVSKQGGNATVYNSDFHFKSLHFLLTDSLRLLKDNCTTVFYASDKKHETTVGAEVRFGSFVTGEAGDQQATVRENAEDGTLFVIHSCSAANIYELACEPEQGGSWMLSPAELFTVESVKKVKTSDEEYTEIQLRSSKAQSSHDCYYRFSRPTTPPPVPPPAPTPSSSSSGQWLVSAVCWLMATSLSASLGVGSAQL